MKMRVFCPVHVVYGSTWILGIILGLNYFHKLVHYFKLLGIGLECGLDCGTSVYVCKQCRSLHFSLK